jgi:hypothetical protein
MPPRRKSDVGRKEGGDVGSRRESSTKWESNLVCETGRGRKGRKGRKIPAPTSQLWALKKDGRDVSWWSYQLNAAVMSSASIHHPTILPPWSW